MVNRITHSKEPNWLKTLKVSLPLDLSYIPIGLACGILLHASGFNPIVTVLVSLMVFSGGAQFMIASLVLANTPMFSVVLMIFFLELRYALLGSSLSKYLQGNSNWFTFMFAISLNDENYALNYLKFSTDKNWHPSDALKVEHYSLLFWSISNLIGSIVGNAISIDLGIVEFALTALFLYMIVMQIKSLLKIIVAVIAGIAAVFMLMLFKSTLGLVISTLIASFIGYGIETLVRKKVSGSKSAFLKPFKNPAGRPKENVEEEKNNDK